MSCPVCGGIPKFEYKNSRFTLSKCDDCTHVFVDDIPSVEELCRSYSGTGYWNSNCNHQGIFSFEPGQEWEGYVNSRIDNLNHFGLIPNPGYVLEIGCSEGMLLHELKNLGWFVVGCDVNADMKEAGEKLGIPIEIGTFEDQTFTFKFDLVCIIHTLEHMSNPVAVVQKIASILNTNGSLYVEVPTGPEEYENTDHMQFFEFASLSMLLSRFFTQIRVERRSYTNYDKV